MSIEHTCNHVCVFSYRIIPGDSKTTLFDQASVFCKAACLGCNGQAMDGNTLHLMETRSTSHVQLIQDVDWSGTKGGKIGYKHTELSAAGEWWEAERPPKAVM